jgi:hypothetical protein
MIVCPSNANPEYFLVKLFRTCQALYGLVQDERLALLRFDYQRLKSLTESRAIYFDTIERLACERDLWQPGYITADPPTNSQEEAPDRRQAQLQRGIEALLDAIQEVTDGNQCMARSALRRIEAAKTMLIQDDETLNPSDPAWQSPGLVSILLFFRAQETTLQGVLDGSMRLENIQHTFIDGQRAVKLGEVIPTP